MRKIFAVFLLIVCTSTPSSAALVVATCGSVTYTVGQVRQITVDTNGKTCT